MTGFLAVDLPHWLAKTMQVMFFVGAIGAGVVVLFVIKDYVGVILSKDEPADGLNPNSEAGGNNAGAAQQQPQTTR